MNELGLLEIEFETLQFEVSHTTGELVVFSFAFQVLHLQLFDLNLNVDQFRFAVHEAGFDIQYGFAGTESFFQQSFDCLDAAFQ